jgi:predicted RNA-binding protein with PIN domain
MMPYLIDGHNLIPKISGLSLQAVDDEEQLIALLLEFCRRRRKKTEVFFDNSPSGQPRSQNLELGLVIARFVRQGQSADDAIRARLARLGKNARNWTVVSSDLVVQASARAAHAHFVSSEFFAQQIEQALIAAPPNLEKQPDASLTNQEINDWLEFFGADGQNDSNS